MYIVECIQLKMNDFKVKDIIESYQAQRIERKVLKKIIEILDLAKGN